MLRNALEPWHLLVVVAVIMLLFGSKKLPEAARGLGKSLRILKAETRALHDDTPTEAPSATMAHSVGETVPGRLPAGPAPQPD
ncbi:Sec-independent protein translocase subunit TatA [Kitasatospora sp. NPDC059327]|uniref:Sec-independent protein translocase subunit TatA n=1 Tax=Kitasatospora sp. NPDC059327 TaxID=3346803 RepID=UPI0036B75079